MGAQILMKLIGACEIQSAVNHQEEMLVTQISPSGTEQTELGTSENRGKLKEKKLMETTQTKELRLNREKLTAWNHWILQIYGLQRQSL